VPTNELQIPFTLCKNRANFAIHIHAVLLFHVEHTTTHSVPYYGKGGNRSDLLFNTPTHFCTTFRPDATLQTRAHTEDSAKHYMRRLWGTCNENTIICMYSTHGGTCMLHERRGVGAVGHYPLWLASPCPTMIPNNSKAHS